MTNAEWITRELARALIEGEQPHVTEKERRKMAMAFFAGAATLVEYQGDLLLFRHLYRVVKERIIPRGWEAVLELAGKK